METSVQYVRASNGGFDPKDVREAFEENGYVVFPEVVDRKRLTEHSSRLFEEYEKANRYGPLFDGGGGMIMGHLNCFPGEESRFVYDTLEERGIIDLVRQLWPDAVRKPNIGCNFNMPRSCPQNYHIDGYAATAFPIVNVASVDTEEVNGALDILEKTHAREYKYWEILVEKPRSIRVPLRQGDALIRSSMLWHRGMPNRSCRARPMLAFTWENGGSELDDPYTKADGKITFYTNRYDTNWVGRVREHAYVLAPGLNAAARVAVSLLKR